MLAEEFPLVDLELSQRLERAEGLASRRFIEAKQIVFPGSGAEWIEIGGAIAIFDTAQSPLTQTFGLGVSSTPTDEELDTIERFFVDRGAPIYHEISPVIDQSLLQELHKRNYYPMELTNVLYRTIDADWSINGNPALQVRQVKAEEQDAFSNLCAAAWQLPTEFDSFFVEMGKINVRNEHYAAFVVELPDGKPIGGGGLCLNDDVALIAGDCTLPEARGQGGQLALISARVRYALERGYKLMMMCALPGSSSQKNGQRAGMQIAYTRIKWAK